MSSWRCSECGAVFENRQKVIEDAGTFYYCPVCGHDETEEVVPCEQCSEPKPKDLEKYCDSCKEETLDEISAVVLELKMRYDSDLVDWALENWVENAETCTLNYIMKKEG